jgi:hypothetical protein
MSPVPRVTRLSVGLFGLAFHLAAAGLLGLQMARRAPGSPWGVLLAPGLAAAAAGFLVYALLVAPYAAKRLGTARRGVVLYDFLVGMVVEVAVLAVGALLHAAGTSVATLASAGLSGYLAAVAGGAAFSFLWVVGTAFTEVLVLGNAAGFLGFIVLKRVARREAASG